MKKLILLIMAIVTPSLLHADIYATTENGDKVRLKDDSTWEYVIDNPIQDQGETKWIVKESKDPLTDKKIITFMLSADKPGSSIRDTPILVLRKDGGTTNLFIAWQDFLGSNDETIKVTTRIGDGTSTILFWQISTDSTATFFPMSAPMYISQIAKANVLVARTAPYRENPVTAIFDTSGLKELILENSDELGDWLE